MSAALPADVREETLLTADGVVLRAHLVPGADLSVAVVLVPGFSCSYAKPFVRRLADRLARHADVLVVDLRGHGGSAGASTLATDEVLDVDAAVDRARRDHERVVVLGFSMGGGAAIRHAGLLGTRTAHAPDAVIAMSAASRWWRTETRRMRRLHLLAGTTAGRTVTRVAMRTRVAPGAERGWPTPPVGLVGRIAPIPLLLIHGDRDAYLLPDNAQELYAAAGDPRELWLLPGYGHAELAVDDALADRIGAHLPTLLARSPGSAAAPAVTP